MAKFEYNNVVRIHTHVWIDGIDRRLYRKYFKDSIVMFVHKIIKAVKDDTYEREIENHILFLRKTQLDLSRLSNIDLKVRRVIAS